MEKIEELEQKNKELEQKINQLNAGLTNVAFRFETLLRYLFSQRKNIIDIDSWYRIVAYYQKFLAKEQELRNISSVLDRVAQAKLYNDEQKDELDFKFLLDDLHLVDQINNAGGSSKETLNTILDSLNGSFNVKNSLKKYLPE